MKKQKLMTMAICALFFGAAANVNAQFEAGRKMIGLNMSYSSSEVTIPNSSSNNTSKSTDMQVSPQFNYFFNNNISLGLTVMILNSTDENQSTWGKSKTKNSGFGFMVGSRIYSNNDHKLRFFANPQIGLMNMSGETEDLSSNPSPKQTMKSTNLGLIVGGGFTYMLSSNWGLDLGIGNLAALTSTNMEIKREGVSESETRKSLDLTIAPLDLGSFTFGINYFF